MSLVSSLHLLFPRAVGAMPGMVDVIQLPGGVLRTRGGGPDGSAPSYRRRRDGLYFHQPPTGVVVGAGAVGALAGEFAFHSLLLSVGLGLGAMGLAASSDDLAGDVARSSGQMALAAFERTLEVNKRYHLTDKLVKGARTAGWRLKEFDREHAVVHRVTEGTKQAWRGVKEYDKTHKISTRAGTVLSTGFDRLTEVLTPPPSPPTYSSRSQNSRYNSRNNDRPDHEVGVDRRRDSGIGVDGWGGRRGSEGRRSVHGTFDQTSDGRRDSSSKRYRHQGQEGPQSAPLWMDVEEEPGGIREGSAFWGQDDLGKSF